MFGGHWKQSRLKLSCKPSLRLAAISDDYCNVLLAGAPKATTDKLHRLLITAARLLRGTKKFDRGLCQLRRPSLAPWAFLAAAGWGGWRGGHVCIWGQEFRMT